MTKTGRRPLPGLNVCQPHYGTERQAREVVRAEYSATLCDLGVFVDEPAEPIASDDFDVGVVRVG
jgi:hypothetical protein